MAQDAGDVRDAIAQDREELAETVQALASKADVKSRLQHTASDLSERVAQVTSTDPQATLSSATETVRSRPIPFAAAAGFVAGFLIGRRRGRRAH